MIQRAQNGEKTKKNGKNEEKVRINGGKIRKNGGEKGEMRKKGKMGGNGRKQGWGKGKNGKRRKNQRKWDFTSPHFKIFFPFPIFPSMFNGSGVISPAPREFGPKFHGFGVGRECA